MRNSLYALLCLLCFCSCEKKPQKIAFNREEKKVIMDCVFKHLYEDVICYKFWMPPDSIFKAKIKLEDLQAIGLLEDSLCAPPPERILRDKVKNRLCVLDTSFRQTFSKIEKGLFERAFIGDLIAKNTFGITPSSRFDKRAKTKKLVVWHRISRVIFNPYFTIGFFYIASTGRGKSGGEEVLIVRKKNGVWEIDEAILISVV